MANLEEMREFQKHWAAYCAGERELTLLKTRPPIDLESLTDADRRLPMTGMPERRASRRARACAETSLRTPEGPETSTRVVGRSRWQSSQTLT